MAEVSIVVPVYNAAKYLPRCIDSVRSQTFADCEFIFVNDGSTDESHDLIAAAAAKDPRVILVDKKNGGVSSARNAGLDRATSPFVAFVDADDHAAPWYVRALYECLQKSGAGLSVCGLQSTAEKALPEGVMRLSADDEAKVLALFRSYLIHNVYCKLYRRDLIETHGLRFDQRYDYGEDFLFNLSYIAHIDRIATTPEILYHYDTSVPGSLSKKFDLKRFSDIETQHALTEDYFDSIGLKSMASRRYLDTLHFWNAYDAVHDTLDKIRVTPKATSLANIRTILNFHYFCNKNSSAEKPTWLMKLFALRRPGLTWFLARQYRKRLG